MKRKIPIYGMHCKSCEFLIENKLSNVKGLKIRSISSRDNYVEVDLEDEKILEEIKKIIEELGYTTQEKNIKKNSVFDYVIISLAFIIFGTVYLLFKDIRFFGDILKSGNLSFFIILLIGFVASLSSCLAVTGGVIIGFAKYVDTSKNAYSHLKTQLSFHIGRILGFMVLGGILGSIGGILKTFGFLNNLLLFLAGIFMLYMGFNMLGFIKLKIGTPKVLWSKILNIKNPVLAPLVGALTFFLPCGFTQSMQVYAASSGSFLTGAIIMGTFALGTMPVLFLMGFGSSYFKDKNFNYVNKIIGVLVVYFGISVLSGFFNMFNLNISTLSNFLKQTNTNLEELEELKEISVIHDGFGFPDVILKGAKNYKLTIDPISDGLGCMFALTIPGIDENEYPVKKGIPIVLYIKNPVPGKYKAVCTAMGMKHGNIVIK